MLIHVGIRQGLDEVDGGELASQVHVEDVGLAVSGQRLFDGLDAERGLQRDRQPPSQHASAEPIDERRPDGRSRAHQTADCGE
ncbi:MAG: hypothetical protein EOR51_19935 [Mesorhizobium sp.]|nr:MAG: hypothetical protein EOR51_19935 [Mesorhizobium sp.]